VLAGFRSIPGLGPLLRDRGIASLFAAAGGVQLAAGMLGLKTFPCPMLHGTGLPCPGCCATRACVALLRGQWHRTFVLHAMAPFFLVGIGLFTMAAVLPRKSAGVLIDCLEHVEARTSAVKLLLVLLILYWIGRLVYAPAEFAAMARGDCVPHP
jgi:hypothetical protein